LNAPTDDDDFDAYPEAACSKVAAWNP